MFCEFSEFPLIPAVTIVTERNFAISSLNSGARFLDLTVGRRSEQACRAFGGEAL